MRRLRNAWNVYAEFVEGLDFDDFHQLVPTVITLGLGLGTAAWMLTEGIG